ncbi:restriction endonuclease [Psittacicella hinzii]|uniref:Restriction endonuclease n=1 Tax=Psittacicella hinzii TaxID=2028575 RepID=A0A3A1Y1P2_9GAMM|nr:restriction endonuclease [Psittacicella hinzii]RIY31148.1 restriction endonuclease [Psittacicella hinzii]
MRIRQAAGRVDGNSAYIRLFDNPQLGALISKVQSTVISNGSELERLVLSRCNVIQDLDIFIDNVAQNQQERGIYVCHKRTLRKSSYIEKVKGIEPDILIFIVENRYSCKVVELKDGDSFDTKKAKAEKNNLETFVLKFGSIIPFVTEYYVCCFNQEDKNLIYQGFKGEITYEHILTGKELCEILKIDYDEIIKIRKEDAVDNLNYFAEELTKIPELVELIKKHL